MEFLFGFRLVLNDQQIQNLPAEILINEINPC